MEQWNVQRRVVPTRVYYRDGDNVVQTIRELRRVFILPPRTQGPTNYGTRTRGQNLEQIESEENRRSPDRPRNSRFLANVEAMELLDSLEECGLQHVPQNTNHAEDLAAMEQGDLQVRVVVVRIFYRNGENAIETLSQWGRHFFIPPRTLVPNIYGISRWVQNFEQPGSEENRWSGRRPHISGNPENAEAMELSQSFEEIRLQQTSQNTICIQNKNDLRDRRYPRDHLGVTLILTLLVFDIIVEVYSGGSIRITDMTSALSQNEKKEGNLIENEVFNNIFYKNNYSYIENTKPTKYTHPFDNEVMKMRSSRENYGDSAIGYVQIKREGSICNVKAQICPEHRFRNKNYHVSLIINEEKEEIVDLHCDDCAASLGGCKHSLALLMYVHIKSEEKSPTEVECYWKRPKLY
ncbi:Protein of unknown function DUF4817 [Cinara cedri]|uniref:DUF4817 domain-containing protein n=1 Tax=Cinara cedri TaxID=506608 RepID=A0A5E4N283_9HEMI|nr:Protein of unknown function DUF4817 [Cinara cedri]